MTCQFGTIPDSFQNGVNSQTEVTYVQLQSVQPACRFVGNTMRAYLNLMGIGRCRLGIYSTVNNTTPEYGKLLAQTDIFTTELDNEYTWYEKQLDRSVILIPGRSYSFAFFYDAQTASNYVRVASDNDGSIHPYWLVGGDKNDIDDGFLPFVFYGGSTVSTQKEWAVYMIGEQQSPFVTRH